MAGMVSLIYGFMCVAILMMYGVICMNQAYMTARLGQCLRAVVSFDCEADGDRLGQVIALALGGHAVEWVSSGGELLTHQLTCQEQLDRVIGKCEQLYSGGE